MPIIVKVEPSFPTLPLAVKRAARDCALSEERRYVLRCADGTFDVCLRPPMLGEWYEVFDNGTYVRHG
jgi:hypothetical protein